MNKHLKTALIVGGNGGIGLSATKKLLDDGFKVYATYNQNKDKLEQISNYPEVSKNLEIIKLNVTSESEVKKKVTKILKNEDRIDVIVLSVSEKYKNIRISELGWDEISNNFNNQVKSLYNLYNSMREQIKSKVKTKFIILLSDVCIGLPPKGFTHYVSSKYALMGLAKSLSVELAPYATTVNMISPGMVETDMLINMPKKLLEINANQNPLGRNGNTEDVASVISFLASDLADYINGINIPINGGSKLT